MIKTNTFYILHLGSIYIGLVHKTTLDRFASKSPISKISVLMAAYNEEITFDMLTIKDDFKNFCGRQDVNSGNSSLSLLFVSLIDFD